MSAFLVLLVKCNLAMGMAVVVVALLRRPLRRLFGAPIAYAIWLLVPIAGLAVLLPPRVVELAPVAAVAVPAASVPVMAPIAHSALSMTAKLAGQSALMLTVPPPAAAHAMPDAALLLFAAWVLGAALMALYLARLQLRFSAAVRAGRAGPAVLGFIRPRIVTPHGFADHFTAREQAAILAHEQVHLARQDARINALAALLRCLGWFNPLIHLGARLLRIDQELACDACVVAGAISRRAYAQALLKSQMIVTALPLGCNWPGSPHPLIVRIALLKRKAPGPLRRLAGVSLVLLAAGFAGFSAWAAQPSVEKPAAARPPLMVLAAPPVQVAASSKRAQEPAAASNDVAAPEDIRSDEAAFVAPAPKTIRIDATTGSVLAALPHIAPVSEPRIIDQASQDAQSKQALAKNGVTAPTTEGAASATGPVMMPDTPSGEGDPDTIVCRAPQRFPGTDKFGEEACGHNYEWQKLALNGKDLAADDKTLIPRTTGSVAADVIAAGAATDAPSPGASGPHTATEPALACLLGFVPWQCASRLWGGAVWPITNCAKQYVHKWLDNCMDGPLERVDYLGINVAGADVYDVHFMHSEVVYIIAPPGPDGKLGWFKIKRGNLNAIVPSSLIDVSASAANKTTLYRRPWR